MYEHFTVSFSRKLTEDEQAAVNERFFAIDDCYVRWIYNQHFIALVMLIPTVSTVTRRRNSSWKATCDWLQGEIF